MRARPCVQDGAAPSCPGVLGGSRECAALRGATLWAGRAAPKGRSRARKPPRPDPAPWCGPPARPDCPDPLRRASAFLIDPFYFGLSAGFALLLRPGLSRVTLSRSRPLRASRSSALKQGQKDTNLLPLAGCEYHVNSGHGKALVHAGFKNNYQPLIRCRC